MTARDEMLAAVRSAIQRTPGQPVAPPPEARIRIPDIAPEERIRLFQERLEVLGGKVHRTAAFAQVHQVVAGLIGSDAAVAANSPVLARTAIASLPGVSTGFSDEASLRSACATAPFGITAPDYGLAETGSVVTIASNESRLASLLPPVHIAVLPSCRLLTGLDEFYSRIPLPAEDSASTVFITGPSRSADIEMILVRGVHGPRAIHVIVVDEELS